MAVLEFKSYTVNELSYRKTIYIRKLTRILV